MSQISADPCGFAAWLDTPIVADVWLYKAVQPGRMVKGPFPNPGCPRISNTRCGAQARFFPSWMLGTGD